MVVLSTYSLYGGVIIGDQWFHHGRALSFVSSTFNAASLSDEHIKDPPFFPAFLAGFFSMSGLPTVNAYAAIDFLNIVPVFAFYYFFSKWVPVNRRKAALLASVLFMLSSGFGWLYLLYLVGANQATSEQASLDAFNDARIKSFDIFQPSSFVVVDHPGISSPLIVVSLPAGFLLLGIIAQRADQKESKIRDLNYFIIVTVCLPSRSFIPSRILFIFVCCLGFGASIQTTQKKHHTLWIRHFYDSDNIDRLFPRTIFLSSQNCRDPTDISFPGADVGNIDAVYYYS